MHKTATEPRDQEPPAGHARKPTERIGPMRSDFEFPLPPELIAQHPAQPREAARLLHVRAQGFADERVADLPDKLRAGDVLVLNDTKVIPARLQGTKSTGGHVEVLLERALSSHAALVQLRSSHPPRSGSRLNFIPASPSSWPSYGATVLGRRDDLFELEFDQPVDQVLEQAGAIPLPPYIRHAPDADDAARYQTVYARAPGAVAAPTAGLHLSAALMDQLLERGVRIAYVTLHVGAGTFQPVRVERLNEHRMHSERYEVPTATADLVNEARRRGHAVVAVGTTSVRALESNMRDGNLVAGSGETRLFILPGYAFQCVDRLVTNFHLPGSTLLMLISAFGGMQRVRQAYAHAVTQRYRFFSYGDAMLLERAADGQESLRSAQSDGRRA